MSFSVLRGERGLSAIWNGRQLTSAYAPEREIQRWCDQFSNLEGSLLFVVGDPWGGAAGEWIRRGIRAVSLLPGAAARSHVPPPVEAWAPEDGGLESWLTTVLEREGLESVRWVVWPTFERVAAELVLDWSERFRSVYRERQGSWLSTRRFGPRQWRNAVRNACQWNWTFAPSVSGRALVVAASGPSLIEGLSSLEHLRPQFELWALPSSFYPLIQRGLEPDFGVTTDAGYYAREHLHRLKGTSIPLWAALGSAPDPVASERPVAYFSQGLEIERRLLTALTGHCPEVPSQGTVAVSALNIALEMTRGPVFVVGLDLAFYGRRGHAWPHTTERRVLPTVGRLTPLEGWFTKASIIEATQVLPEGRTSPALFTYAQWLGQGPRFSRTVSRIEPSVLSWKSMKEVSWQEAERVLRMQEVRPPPARTSDPLPGPPHRIPAVREVLKAWIDDWKGRSDEDEELLRASSTALPEIVAERRLARRRGLQGPALLPAFLDFLKSLAKEVE